MLFHSQESSPEVSYQFNNRQSAGVIQEGRVLSVQGYLIAEFRQVQKEESRVSSKVSGYKARSDVVFTGLSRVASTICRSPGLIYIGLS